MNIEQLTKEQLIAMVAELRNLTIACSPETKDHEFCVNSRGEVRSVRTPSWETVRNARAALGMLLQGEK